MTKGFSSQENNALCHYAGERTARGAHCIGQFILVHVRYIDGRHLACGRLWHFTVLLLVHSKYICQFRCFFAC